MTLAIEAEPTVDADGDAEPEPVGVRMQIAPGETRRFSAGTYRWTVEDFRKLCATDLFGPNRAALIQGVIYVSAMPSELHSQAALQVGRVMRRLFAERDWDVREEKGFVVPPNTNCGPDVAVVRRPAETPTENPRVARLVVEVALTTLADDLQIMADLYAAADVPLYLVLAPKKSAIYLHTEPRPNAVSETGHRYASVVKLDVGQSVTLNDPAATSVAVADLLGVASPA